MRTAVYWLTDADENVIYIGISCRPDERLRAHKRDQPWGDEIAGMDLEWHETREEAFAAETQDISEQKPVYNINGTPGCRPNCIGGKRPPPVTEEDLRRAILSIGAKCSPQQN